MVVLFFVNFCKDLRKYSKVYILFADNINVSLYGDTMPEEYSININDFIGVHRAMAEKANVNGGKTLDNIEISIFNEILSTYDQKDDTFIIENTIYDKDGKKIDYAPLKIGERVSTRISFQKPIEDFEKDVKNSTKTKQAFKRY